MMNKTFAGSSSVAGLVLLLAGPAFALTLTNLDAVEQRVKVSEGGDEIVSQDVVIGAGQTLDGLCMEGCTIVHENGEQESFEGDESVNIKNGIFEIAD